MKTTVRRVAGKVTETVREMHEAQQHMLALTTATDHYGEHRGTAPDTYQEFMAMTSGALRHEPSARKRARRTWLA
jgi:hypothetical protein